MREAYMKTMIKHLKHKFAVHI